MPRNLRLSRSGLVATGRSVEYKRSAGQITVCHNKILLGLTVLLACLQRANVLVSSFTPIYTGDMAI